MATARLDEFFHGAAVFFLKVDVENAEEYALGGFDHHLSTGRVAHLVMETRKNQARGGRCRAHTRACACACVHASGAANFAWKCLY